MSQQEKNSNVLKQPKMGPQQEVSPEAAYLAAVTCLPRVLSDIGKVLSGMLDELNGIHDKLDVMALYYERKGTEENYFGPDDFPAIDENDEAPGDENDEPQ